MKKSFIIFLLLTSVCVFAQDENVLLQQAANAEKQFNENDALNIYKQALALDTSNINILVKCTELNCSIGENQTDKTAKINYFNTAKTFADKAFTMNAASADANYAEALVFSKLSSAETENKQVAEDIKQTYFYSDKAISINPNHTKANYILGKWHYEMLSLSWFKKAALKTLYGGLPKADIDTAIFYMEKCRTLDIYFLPDYLDLAKAYQFKNRPQQAIDVLTKLVHMPNRAAGDAALKAEGQKMLDAME